MSQEPLSTLDYPQSELVFGLVYAVGTNEKPIQQTLEDHLKKFGYRPRSIRLSDYLPGLVNKLGLGIKVKNSSEYDRIDSRMDAGNAARERTKRGDFLALCACGQIARSRRVQRKIGIPKPHPKTAHILLSLKRPEEVVALRRIYGAGFFLVAVFASEKDRSDFLTGDKGLSPKQAKELIQRDEEETQDFGQRTRDTFHLADVFVSSTAKSYKNQIWRFVNLVFSHPFETPTKDENAMFLAYAASARSASFSRQVGAAITSSEGEIIGVGCNDVPCAGGGLYWPGGFDKRDHLFRYRGVTGIDSNEACRDEILQDIIARLKPEIAPPERVGQGRRILRGSPLLDITEYGRAVHAEMEAMMSCIRAGVSPRHGALYTTTFPCHNCARHIIASGIRRVVYIEPYPKSRALDLHNDSLTLLQKGIGTKLDARMKTKVEFASFVGIGPRRYLDLFSLRLSTGYPKMRQIQRGRAKAWQERNARVRVPMLPTSYLQREKLAVEEIDRTLIGMEVKKDGKD